MTKYILQSGGLRKNSQKTAMFFNEIVRDFGDRPRVLLCFFAEKRGHWEDKVEEYKKGFLALLEDGINPEFELALPSEFEEQVKRSDVVYLYGGDDELLMLRLGGFDLERLWKDKTVATISAGTDALSKHFWTCDWRKCMDGFGLLPIKVIPHYNSDYGSEDPRGPIDWQGAYDELKEYGDKSLPIHALEEGDYIVIEK